MNPEQFAHLSVGQSGCHGHSRVAIPGLVANMVVAKRHGKATKALRIEAGRMVGVELDAAGMFADPDGFLE